MSHSVRCSAVLTCISSMVKWSIWRSIHDVNNKRKGEKEDKQKPERFLTIYQMEYYRIKNNIINKLQLKKSYKGCFS